MIGDIQEFYKWLNERCPEDQLALKDGVLYLPIDTCERKLDLMREKFNVHWHEANYISRTFIFNSRLFLSASIEIYFTYSDKEIKRVVGCATIVGPTENLHLDATAKSLAVVNACSDLGDQFGRFLSSQSKKMEHEKEKPDAIALKQKELAEKSEDIGKLRELYDRYDMEFDEYYLNLIKQ